jgi:arylsulfatase A-like enzyme
MKKYNIILVVLDGARADKIKKFPFFKSVIAKGTLFSNMITYAPSTIASHYAIFSGTYGSENGCNNYWASKSFKTESYKTLPEYLKNNGYFTAADSINELALPPFGIDDLRVHNEYKDDLVKRHIDFISEVSDKKPFFLYLNYSKIHASTTKNVMDKTTGEYDESYYNNKEKNSSNFDDYMKEADDYFGNLMKKLDELDLLKDSVIILMADHGTSIGEKFGERRYGVYCYDYSIRTFCLFVQPELFPVKEINKQVRTVDIMPTLMEILDIKLVEKLPKLRGLSLIPTIDGSETIKRLAFTETATFDEPSRNKPNIGSVRTEKWKIIYNKVTNTVEFYDLENDTNEENNLAGKGIEEEKLLFQVLKEEMNIIK